MKGLHFTKQDTLHAALGVVPGFVLICLGHLTVGVAFAIGLLPTSLFGIAPSRKMRLVFGVLGCLFGVGVSVGSWIVNVHSTWGAAAILFGACVAAALVAAKRPAGGVLLALIIPSLAVGTGYSIDEALRLTVAFVLGSLWSSVVSLLWPEFAPDPTTPQRLQALQPANAALYGILLGLAVGSAYVIGSHIDPDHAGWVATAAMLVMRPLQDMTGLRGVGRALSTIVGTLLVVVAIKMQLGVALTAVLVAAVTIVAIGGRTSRWYITSFGTAFLILTIELHGSTDFATIHEVASRRILDNVVGAAIAMFFGLAVPLVLMATGMIRQPPALSQPSAGEAA